MLQIENNPKTNSSFSALNEEKVSKLNNLILESMRLFNTKYKEINDNLMELKLEFLNHINAVQSLLKGNDEDEICSNPDNLISDNIFKGNYSPPSYKKNVQQNQEKNLLNLQQDDKDTVNRFERNIERKKTYNQVLRQNYKLSSILFNRDRRDDISKKNVTFHPQHIFKENTPGRKIKKKNKENNDNKNINENNDNENKNINNNENNDENNNNKNNENKNINNENNNMNNNENNNMNNNENNNINKNENKNNLSNNNLINVNQNNLNEIELLSENLRNKENNNDNKKKKKRKITELDLNINKNEENSLTSEEEFSSINKENENHENNMNEIEELNKTIFPSKTSQSGINFITKKKEEKIYSDTSDLGKELCNLLYIILGFEEKFDGKKSLKDLFDFLFNSFNVKGIKDLFLKIIYNKVYINEDISEGLFITFNQLITLHLKEIKLLCQARNQPLSWIAINILEIEKYFKMLFNKDK